MEANEVSQSCATDSAAKKLWELWGEKNQPRGRKTMLEKLCEVEKFDMQNFFPLCPMESQLHKMYQAPVPRLMFSFVVYRHWVYAVKVNILKQLVCLCVQRNRARFSRLTRLLSMRY